MVYSSEIECKPLLNNPDKLIGVADREEIDPTKIK